MQYKAGMDQFLIIPKGRKPSRTVMLPLMLGLTALLYLVLLSPAERAQTAADAAAQTTP